MYTTVWRPRLACRGRARPARAPVGISGLAREPPRLGRDDRWTPLDPRISCSAISSSSWPAWLLRDWPWPGQVTWDRWMPPRSAEAGLINAAILD